MWENSRKVVGRDTRVIFYDCTNYYFEIEDNDPCGVDRVILAAPRAYAAAANQKSTAPTRLCRWGCSWTPTASPVVHHLPRQRVGAALAAEDRGDDSQKFELNEFVISTDSGISSEDNRRYNMTEGREYIAVQSLPKLPEADRKMALDPHGWHVAFRDSSLGPICPDDPGRDTFNLDEIDLEAERHTKFYKEIIVDKCICGRRDTSRPERVIVTYCHDFALYLRHKRAERIAAAEKIIRRKQANSRQSQQDPRKYVSTVYVTKGGEVAKNISMSLNTREINDEARFDGFYAYGTSLDDDAVDVLRARSFHHEIEHLFRTTKSFLDARPVYLQRADRIRSHFLVCFLSMVILKILQKQLDMPSLSIDRLIGTVGDFKLGYIRGAGYIPLFERNEVTDRLQEINGICVDTQIVTTKALNAMYRKMLK